jgi:hypothetical protein
MPGLWWRWILLDAAQFKNRPNAEYRRTIDHEQANADELRGWNGHIRRQMSSTTAYAHVQQFSRSFMMFLSSGAIK